MSNRAAQDQDAAAAKPTSRGLWLAFFVGVLLAALRLAAAADLKPWPGAAPAEAPGPGDGGTAPAPAKNKPARPPEPTEDPAQAARDRALKACLSACSTAENQGYAACEEPSSLPAAADCNTQIASAAGVCRARCHK